MTLATVGAVAAGLLPHASATPAASQDNVRLIKNVPGSTGGHAVVEGNRLYVGAYGLGMRIFDVSTPSNPTEIGRYFPGPQGTSDPGARADAVPDAAVFDGRHIATLNGTSRTASTTQTEFLDVTDAANPKLLWRFTGANDGEAHNGDIVDSRRIWLPSGGSGNNGLRIYDLSPVLANPPAAPANLMRANPTTLWRDSPYRGNRSVGPAFSHTHDIEIYSDYRVLLPQAQWTDQDGDGIADPTYALRDIALLADALQDSVFVIDITNPRAPVVLNRWIHPSAVGHDPIDYLHEAQFLQGDPHVMIVTDEDFNGLCGPGDIVIVRVSEDLTQAEELSEFSLGTDNTRALCSAHVFSSNGPYVFMGAYDAGLQVIDLSDPAKPKRAGHFTAEGADSWGALYHQGVVYVGDLGGRGLDVFEFIPNPAAEGLIKVNNPSVTQVPGITETALEQTCDPNTPANGMDGLIVPIPPELRDGTHLMRSVGNGDAPYNLNVYWYDAECTFIGGVSHNTENPDEYGHIPEGGAFGVIDLVTGPAMHVYAQFDPAGPGLPPPFPVVAGR
jgi:hypothetical protein